MVVDVRAPSVCKFKQRLLKLLIVDLFVLSRLFLWVILFLHHLFDLFTIFVLLRDDFLFLLATVIVKFFLYHVGQIVEVNARPEDLANSYEDSHILIFGTHKGLTWSCEALHELLDS